MAERLHLHRPCREARASSNRTNGAPEPGREVARRAAPPSPPERKRRRARALSREAGQVTLETVALIPVALVVMVLCLQMLLVGISFVWSGVAATAAARAASIGTDPVAAGRAALPGSMQARSVVRASGSSISVTVRAPLLMGNGVTRDVDIEVAHRVVEEPR